jgi:hypothetical protein
MTSGPWDFGLYLYGTAGNKVYNGKKAQRFGGENVEYDLNYDLYSPTSNPDGSSPRPFNDVPIASDYYVENASFLRINNLSVGYTYPGKIFRFTSQRIYFTCVNLYTLTGYSGFTPEVVGDDNANPMGSAGIELDAYPTNRAFIVGLNIRF